MQRVIERLSTQSHHVADRSTSNETNEWHPHPQRHYTSTLSSIKQLSVWLGAQLRTTHSEEGNTPCCSSCYQLYASVHEESNIHHPSRQPSPPPSVSLPSCSASDRVSFTLTSSPTASSIPSDQLRSTVHPQHVNTQRDTPTQDPSAPLHHHHLSLSLRHSSFAWHTNAFSTLKPSISPQENSLLAWHLVRNGAATLSHSEPTDRLYEVAIQFRSTTY